MFIHTLEDLGQSSELFVINPITVYHLTVNQSGRCSSGRCKMTNSYTFNYKQGSSCKFKFICSRLGGNVCGSYGVDLILHNDTFSPCHHGQLKTGRLDSGMSLSMELWYTDQSLLDVACYFWCSKDGHMPKPMIEDVNQASLNHLKMLPKAVIVMDFKMNLKQFSMAVASQQLYTFNLSNNEMRNSNEMARFEWYYHDPCYFTMMCTKLEENPCGDFSLSLDNGTARVELCQPLVKYRLMVTNGLSFSVWKSTLSAFSATCYFWCSSGSEATLPTQFAANPKTTLVKQEMNQMVSNSEQLYKFYMINI